MGIGTLLRYLIGERTAILTLAEHPRSWLVGLIFVLSAGFAREYDQEDLLHDPWYLLLPLGASLLSSFLLFCVLYGPTMLLRKPGPPFLTAYRAFLGLFWLTAPLAWLYAIPYERLLDSVSAVHANLATLAVVSAWRVALMVRVAVVLLGMPLGAAFFRVLAYADGVALAAVSFLPFPIIEIMGGVHLTEAESAVRGAAQFIGCWGGCTFLIWFMFAVSLNGTTRWQNAGTEVPPTMAMTWSLRGLAVLSLAFWIGILPFTQPEQQLRRRVEIAFRDGRVVDAVAEMSAHRSEDFPPHWDPPPRFLKGEPMSQLFEIWDGILSQDAAPWVRQRYLAKLKDYMHRGHFIDGEKTANLLNHVPEGEAILREEDERGGKWVLERLEPHLRPELRKAIRSKQ
jgi:hypothetical protein